MTFYYIPGPKGEKPTNTPLGAVPIDKMGYTPKPSKPCEYSEKDCAIPVSILKAFAGLDPTPEPISSQPLTPARKSKGNVIDHLFM